MSLKTTEFDPAAYLTKGETVVSYLSEALEHEDARGLVDALGDVVRARGGVERLAADTSLPADVVRHAVSETEPVNLEAILQVLHALKVRLSASLVA